MTDLFARKSDFRGRGKHAAPKAPSKIAKNAMHTLPFLLVGSIAMSLNMTSPINTTDLKRNDKPKDSNEQLRNAVSTAMANAAHDDSSTRAASSGSFTALASTPTTYRVVSGDTVSSIASKHGLSTASVLALNGLGWKSLIFPGQILVLTNTPAAPPATTQIGRAHV